MLTIVTGIKGSNKQDTMIVKASYCIILDENLCAKNPCKNGGTCQRIGGDFYCECGQGFAGKYCENSKLEILALVILMLWLGVGYCTLM